MRRFRRLTAFAAVLVIVVSSLGFSAAAKGGSIALGTASVQASSLTVRASAGNKGEAIGRVQRGDTVVVLEKTNNVWYKVNYQGTVGYVAARYLRDIRSVGKVVAAGQVNDDFVRIRELPNTECSTYGYLSTGKKVLVMGLCDGWYKVRADGKTGYMRSDYVDLVGSYVPSQFDTDDGKDPDPGDPGDAPGSELGNQIAEYCKQFVGYDYVYGGASPETGFDCSGLMYYVYGHFGITIARGATSQYNQNGYVVSYDEMVPGDLIFFANPNYGEGITHVGMYIGDGKMVHASDYDVGVIISDVTTAHYRNTFYAAKRIVD